MNEKERFLVKVWPRITEFFDRFGSANYAGVVGIKEKVLSGPGWLGPYIWSENGDTLRIITRFCEDEFGFLHVHNESKIDRFRFANFNENESWKSIDIDVTNASECSERDDYEKFRNLTHTLFIEVKQIIKGNNMYRGYEKKMVGFHYDCIKLCEQVKKGRCKYAIAILIDDGDLDGKPYVPSEFIEKMRRSFPSVEILVWQKKGDK
jgi:hypothetical protein